MAKRKTKTKQADQTKVVCAICGHEDFYLADHLMEAHGMTVEEYVKQHPKAETVSNALLDAYNAEKGNPRRSGPPSPDALVINFAGVEFPINTDVPESECLPVPPHYKSPEHGDLSRDVKHAAIAVRRGRSVYVHGLQGSGKDAFFHYLFGATRSPSKVFSVQPGVDLQSWFFSRAFDENGTRWEEGEMLTAIRDGYVTDDGKRLPYKILISDWDRADASQVEALRLILDSIQGRVKGPGGTTYPLLPGTQFVFTGNSAGGGDTRGRCISANPMDSSMMDRVERIFEFRWMDWNDEAEICKAKFPLLVERAPETIGMAGRAVTKIREAIYNEDLYCEFSHRAVCSWLGHAEDLLYCTNTQSQPGTLLRKAARAVLDGMPDEETRMGVRRIMDPFLKGGAMDEGDTSHIEDGNLHEGF